jgi:hypothetical protein
MLTSEFYNKEIFFNIFMYKHIRPLISCSDFFLSGVVSFRSFAKFEAWQYFATFADV